MNIANTYLFNEEILSILYQIDSEESHHLLNLNALFDFKYKFGVQIEGIDEIFDNLKNIEFNLKNSTEISYFSISAKKRRFAKINKVFRTLLPNSDIRNVEILGNMFLSISSCDDILIKEVSGKEISEYYSQETSYTKSCMQSKPIYYFELYECIKELEMIAVIKKSDGKLLGRALLWNVENRKYHDTIYANLEYVQNIISNYCSQNNYTSANLLSTEFKVHNFSEEYFPYVDHFDHYDLRNKTLSPFERKFSEYLILDNIDGSFYKYTGGACFECNEHNELDSTSTPSEFYCKKCNCKLI